MSRLDSAPSVVSRLVFEKSSRRAAPQVPLGVPIHTSVQHFGARPVAVANRLWWTRSITAERGSCVYPFEQTTTTTVRLSL